MACFGDEEKYSEMIRLFLNIFFGFILSIFEYCSPIWDSLADAYLKMFDRAFRFVWFIIPKLTLNPQHRRTVGESSSFYRILSRYHYPVHDNLPTNSTALRSAGIVLAVDDDRTFTPIHCSTSRAFLFLKWLIFGIAYLLRLYF